MLEKYRLEFVFDRLMHHRAVPVTRDLRIKTVPRVTPRDLANSVTRHDPIAETNEASLELLSVFHRRKIDECVAMILFCVKIDWQVHKVIKSVETLLVD